MKKKFKNQQGLPAIAHNIKFWQAGEIATILTIAVLLVIGTTTFVSSLVLRNKKTTETKAAANDITISNIFSDTGEQIILQNGKCGILEENGQGKIVRNNNGTPVDGLANCQETDFAPVYSKFFTYAKKELEYEEPAETGTGANTNEQQKSTITNTPPPSQSKYVQLSCSRYKGNYNDYFYLKSIKEKIGTEDKLNYYYYEDSNGKKEITNSMTIKYQEVVAKWCIDKSIGNKNKCYTYLNKCSEYPDRKYYYRIIQINKTTKQYQYFQTSNCSISLGSIKATSIKRSTDLDKYCKTAPTSIPVAATVTPSVTPIYVPSTLAPTITPAPMTGCLRSGTCCIDWKATNGQFEFDQDNYADCITNNFADGCVSWTKSNSAPMYYRVYKTNKIEAISCHYENIPLLAGEIKVKRTTLGENKNYACQTVYANNNQVYDSKFDSKNVCIYSGPKAINFVFSNNASNSIELDSNITYKIKYKISYYSEFKKAIIEYDLKTKKFSFKSENVNNKICLGIVCNYESVVFKNNQLTINFIGNNSTYDMAREWNNWTKNNAIEIEYCTQTSDNSAVSCYKSNDSNSILNNNEKNNFYIDVVWE